MKDMCRKFHRILLVELEDLKEDLALFVEMMEARHRSGEITDYVYNENLAVLRNEVLGLDDCTRGCEDMEIRGRAGIDEISAAFKAQFRRRLKERGYVPALYSLLDKRIDKVTLYLKKERSESVDAAPTPGD